MIVSSRDGDRERVNLNMGNAGVLSFSLVYFAHPTCLPGGQGAEAGGGLPVKAAQVSKVLKGCLLPLAVSFCCFFVFFQEVNAGFYFRL